MSTFTTPSTYLLTIVFAILCWTLVLPGWTFAAFNSPVPSGRVSTQEQQNKASEPTRQATTKERGTEDAPLFVKHIPIADSESDAAHKAYEHQEKPTLDRRLTWSTIALAAFTLVLAIFTGLMWLATYRLAVHAKETTTQQAADTKDALTIAKAAADAARDNAVAALGSNRAFVYATPYWVNTGDGGAFFGVRWTNGGNTPTKNMRTRIDHVILDSELPADFAFPDHADPIGTGFLAPKQTFNGPHIPPEQQIPKSTLDEILNGRKRIYFFGWAKYFDVFPGTPERTTTFCFFVNVSREGYGFPIYGDHNEAT